MKFLILIPAILFPLFSLAGGGGGIRPNASMSLDLPSQAYVKFEGMDRADVVFQYGRSTKSDLVFTKQYRLRPEEITSLPVLHALKKSKAQKDWIQVP